MDHPYPTQFDVNQTGKTELDVALDSVAVARLISEVRNAEGEVARAYNRTYNRHNR